MMNGDLWDKLLIPSSLPAHYSEFRYGDQPEVFSHWERCFIAERRQVAPAGTPKEIVARIHGEIVKFVQMPDIRSRFEQQGVELQVSGKTYAAFLTRSSTRMPALVAILTSASRLNSSIFPLRS